MEGLLIMKRSTILLLGGVLISALALPAGAGATTMSHWAQIRDEQGEVIGRVDAGEEVEVLGVCEDVPYRSEIYYPLEDLTGTVASVYIYGGSEYEYENPEEYGNGDEDPEDDESSEKTREYDTEDSETDPEDTDDEDEESESGAKADSRVSIDIDISAQRIYVYNGDELVLGEDCVTGTMDEMDTPEGEFTILEKSEQAVLDGGIYGNGDLYPVRYWMSLTDYGIGIHDAAWRNGVFGGDIYETDGSHGCVNVDTWVASTIYEIAPVGTPVTIHY